MSKLKKKKKGVEALKSKYGRLFVLPWEIGLVLFFLLPIFKSIFYSFTDILITENGFETTWVGFKWYDHFINSHATYLDLLKDKILSLLVQVPIVIALSLVLAIVLNQKFKGRIIARAIFFLPVIIATGVVMKWLTSDFVSISLLASTGEEGNYGSMIDFDAILGNLGLPDEINNLISGYIGDIFNLLWSCGIQIVLFIAGLQTIPDQLYEVSRVEGASKWEEFWYITVPMLGPTILLVMVYTMIDLFVEKRYVMRIALDLMGNAKYDQSSAALWLYFLVAGVVMAIVLFIYDRLCLKRWA